MRTRIVLIVALALVSLPLFAQSNEVAVWGGTSQAGSTDVTGTTIHFDRGRAYGVSFNHFFGDHLSGELAAFELRHDGTIRLAGVNTFDIGSLRMMPIIATAQWHLNRAARLDANLGGGLAYVRSSSLHSSDLDTIGVGRVDVKSKIGWTAVGGVTYNFMPAFGVAAEARYIGYRPDSGPSTSRVRLELSPTVFALGLRWRF